VPVLDRMRTLIAELFSGREVKQNSLAVVIFWTWRATR